jgi:hypothetical protein
VSDNSFGQQYLVVPQANFSDITDHFSISQGWKTSLPSFSSWCGTSQTNVHKKARSVLVIVLKSDVSPAVRQTHKGGCCIETNLNMLPANCELSRRNDVHLCSIYVGKMALTPTHPRTDRICSPIVFLLNTGMACSDGFSSRTLADQIANPNVLSWVLWRVVLFFKLAVTRLIAHFDINNFYW